MRALVIGDQGEIGDPLRQTFARTGMAHLLVISGLHLSIVAAAMFALARLAMMLLPGLANRGYANKVAALAAIAAVCGYASIAGHHVSTVRALVMVLAYMLAVAIDRSREAVASLALAAIVICIALPGSTADIGFQLSFASVIAIVLGMRRFAAWFARRKRLGMLRGEPTSVRWRYLEAGAGYLAVSFWAMVGTAPLTAYHFNQFAIVGIAANAVVVPIMAFGATISGLIAAALSFISEPLARPILLFGANALAAGNWLAAWFVDWPLAWFRIFTPTILELTIAYAFLMLWLLAPLAVAIKVKRPRDVAVGDPSPPKFGWRARCAIALAVVLMIDAGYWTYDRIFNPDLRVTFLSVGEGDGAVVRFPGSRVMVIDAGGSFGGFDAGERIVAPYLWSQKIMHVDYLALSHPDLDHFGGLDFIAMNFAPQSLWTTNVPSLDVSYARLMDDLARARIPIVQVRDIAPVAVDQRRQDLVSQRRHRRHEDAQQQLDGVAIQLQQHLDPFHRRHRVGRRARDAREARRSSCNDTEGPASRQRNFLDRGVHCRSASGGSSNLRRLLKQFPFSSRRGRRTLRRSRHPPDAHRPQRRRNGRCHAGSDDCANFPRPRRRSAPSRPAAGLRVQTKLALSTKIGTIPCEYRS